MRDRTRPGPRRADARILFVATILLLFTFDGCRRKEAPVLTDSGATDAISTDRAESGGTVVRRLSSDVKTLNMAFISTDAEKQVLSYILDPLVDLDNELQVVPAIAESWDVSPDGRIYTFHLQEAATFSDGTPVRAKDVMFTIQRLVDPDLESPQFSALFEGFDPASSSIVDPLTLRIGFKVPRASQLLAFNIGILPEHIYSKGDFSKDFNDTVVGSGPYLLSSFERGKQVTLDLRKNYWRPAPYVERILFKIIPNDAVAWKAMKVADIDEMLISSDQWKFERDDPQVQKLMDIRRFYGLGYNFIPWNERNPILADRRVRKALSMCLDRKSIIANVYYGTARIITGPFTPDQWAYNPDVPPIPYNPAEARRIFASLGWNDTDGDGVLDRKGQPLELELLLSAGNSASMLQAQIFQSALKSIGVRLKLTPIDFASLIDRVTTGNYDGAMLAWGLDLDPDVYSYFHSSEIPPHGQNIVHYSSPEADQLIVQGRNEFDFKKRVEIYHRLHALLAEDQPYTWTLQVSQKWAVNRRIQNVQIAGGLGPFEWYPGPFEWWIPASKRTHEPLPKTP